MISPVLVFLSFIQQVLEEKFRLDIILFLQTMLNSHGYIELLVLPSGKLSGFQHLASSI